MYIINHRSKPLYRWVIYHYQSWDANIQVRNLERSHLWREIDEDAFGPRFWDSKREAVKLALKDISERFSTFKTCFFKDSQLLAVEGTASVSNRWIYTHYVFWEVKVCPDTMKPLESLDLYR